MNSATTRRYAVGFSSWTLYETIVLARNAREAIAKGKALYNRNGLGELSVSDFGEEPWHAQCLEGKLQS